LGVRYLAVKPRARRGRGVGFEIPMPGDLGHNKHGAIRIHGRGRRRIGMKQPTSMAIRQGRSALGAHDDWWEPTIFLRLVEQTPTVAFAYRPP
jgi:hypothetical protein